LEGGLAVKTSLDPKLQNIATRALREGLIEFDRRERGWRGAVARLTSLQNWQTQLEKIAMPAGGEAWKLAAVIGLKDNQAELAVIDGKRGTIPWSEIKWARRELANDEFGPAIKKPADVLAVGDVIMVEQVKITRKARNIPPELYTLRQVPAVQGALVALDPHTGRVFCYERRL